MMTSKDELTDLKAQSPCLLEHRYLLPVSKIISMFKGLTNKKLPRLGTPRFSITHLRVQAGVTWMLAASPITLLAPPLKPLPPLDVTWDQAVFCSARHPPHPYLVTALLPLN